MHILVVNSGSSSIKCSLFETRSLKKIWNGILRWNPRFDQASMTTQTSHRKEKIEVKLSSSKEGIEKILEYLPSCELSAICHRVVHGGDFFLKAVPITNAVKEKIKELYVFAPLHNPENMEGIEVTQMIFRDCPHFAAFDTSFHHTLSTAASTYPLPHSFLKKGIKRYGFHGISHHYCSKRAALFLKKNIADLHLLICHLGSGSSLCAVKGGKSCDTTMGMTPLEGLMMSTRSGTLDPGIILYLLKAEKFQIDNLEHLLNYQSGLLGLSGISADIRDVIKASFQGNEEASLALDVFIHRLQSHIGMMMASLGRLDAVVFTGGIGENISYVREKAMEPFSSWQIEIDPEKNESLSLEEREISSIQSRVRILVIPTQEEWEIAYECKKLL